MVLALELIIVLFHIVKFLYDLLLLLFLLNFLQPFLVFVELLLCLVVQLVEVVVIYYVVLRLHEINELYSLRRVLLQHRVKHVFSHLSYWVRVFVFNFVIHNFLDQVLLGR